MQITKDLIQRICPRPAGAKQAAIWDGYVDALLSPAGLDLLRRYDITTERRWCYLIATWACETGGLTLVWEDGNYTAERILQVFRDKGIVTYAEAASLAHNPYALFERTYGLGCPHMARELGNTQKGDGYRFRGCGITQLTGRGSHQKSADVIGCPLDEVEKPINSIHGALIEWQEKKCNSAIDREAGFGFDATAKEVRRRINGGSNGLPLFRQYLAIARRIWPDTSGPVTPSAIAQLGDRGDAVKQVQLLLTAAGFSPGAADGIFGVLTERAVAGFQVGHGLPGTGRVDDKTLADLKDAAANPPAAATVARASTTTSDLVKQGSETATDAQKVTTTGKAVAGVSLGLLTDMATGFSVVDSIFDQIEKAQAVATKAGSSFAMVLQPRVIVTLLTLALGLALWKWGSRINWRHLLDFKSGANLGATATPAKG